MCSRYDLSVFLSLKIIVILFVSVASIDWSVTDFSVYTVQINFSLHKLLGISFSKLTNSCDVTKPRLIQNTSHKHLLTRWSNIRCQGVHLKNPINWFNQFWQKWCQFMPRLECGLCWWIQNSLIHPEETVLFPARIHDVEWMIPCSNVVRLWQRHRKTQTKAMAAFAEEPILIDTASRSLLHWMLSFIFLMAVLVAQQCITGKNELMSCLGLLMLLFYPSVTDQFMISSPFFTVRCFQSRRHLSRWLRNVVPAAYSLRHLLHFAYLFYEGIWLDPLIRMHACFLDCCMCMCAMSFAILIEY